MFARNRPVTGSGIHYQHKSMKEKISKELRNEYANLGLGEKAFSGVAAFLEKTGIKEEDITSRIKDEDVKSLLVAIQGESDSLRNTNTRLTKENEELKAKTGKPEGKSDGKDDVAKAIAELQEEFKDFKDSSAQRAKTEADAQVLSKVHDIMKSKGCTNDFIRKMTLAGITVSDGDTAESLAEKYKTEYDENFKEAFGDGYIPPMGNHSSKDYEKGAYGPEVERLRASGKIPGESK